MTEPTYTLTLTESERTTLAKSLGLLTTKLRNLTLQIEEYGKIIDFIIANGRKA